MGQRSRCNHWRIAATTALPTVASISIRMSVVKLAKPGQITTLIRQQTRTRVATRTAPWRATNPERARGVQGGYWVGVASGDTAVVVVVGGGTLHADTLIG
jgi:hypothetical protein